MVSTDEAGAYARTRDFSMGCDVLFKLFRIDCYTSRPGVFSDRRCTYVSVSDEARNGMALKPGYAFVEGYALVSYADTAESDDLTGRMDMKVDRVILALNGNGLYAGFWNAFAPVWERRFHIRPTLIFMGTAQDLVRLGIDTSVGDVIFIEAVPDVITGDPDWSITWAFFWGAAQFPDDVCLTHGIDQIPLGSFFFDQLEAVSQDSYVIGFADAYEKYTTKTLGYFNSASGSLYPSSHHVALGRNYRSIYKIDHKSWEDEVRKVYESRQLFHLSNKLHLNNPNWGLDECYSSHMLSFIDQSKITKFRFFWEYWAPRKIDRGGLNLNYDLLKLKEGYYSELHSPRPYLKWKGYLDTLISHL